MRKDQSLSLISDTRVVVKIHVSYSTINFLE